MKPEIKLLQIAAYLAAAGVLRDSVKISFADPVTQETLVCTTRHHVYKMAFNAPALSIAYALADNLHREAAGHALLDPSCPFCPAQPNKGN